MSQSLKSQREEAFRILSLKNAVKKVGIKHRDALINMHIWTNLRYCDKSLKNLHFMRFLRLAQSCSKKEAKLFAQGPIPPDILNSISEEIPDIQGETDDFGFRFIWSCYRRLRLDGCEACSHSIFYELGSHLHPSPYISNPSCKISENEFHSTDDHQCTLDRKQSDNTKPGPRSLKRKDRTEAGCNPSQCETRLARSSIPPPIVQQAILAPPVSQSGSALTSINRSDYPESQVPSTYHRIDVSRLCDDDTPYQSSASPYRTQGIPPPTDHDLSGANVIKPHYIGSVRDIYQEQMRKFEDLRPELQDMLRLLVFAGGWAPEILFTGICKQWGSNGELEPLVEKIPTSRDPDKAKSNLKLLEKQTCISSAVEGQTMYLINPVVFKCVETHTPEKPEWKRRAIDTVLRVFPTDHYMEPINFARIVRAMIPCLNHVLCYFFEGIPTEHPELLVRACRAASLFRDPSWKTFLTRIACQVATSLDNNQLAVEIGLRQVSLSRSTYREDSSVGLEAGIKTLNVQYAHGNAIFGKALLSEARACLYNCKGHQSVEDTLFRFRASTGTSTLEKYIFVESELLLATSLRHEGKFKEAGDRLFALFNRAHPSSLRISSAWNEIQCELGSVSTAIKFLVSEYLSLRLQPFSSGGKRHLLSIANAYLMEALWEKHQHRTVNLRSLSTAESIFSGFRGLPYSNMSANRSLFAVLSGLGMIHLMRSDLVTALSYWEEAADVATKWLYNHKFVQMVVLYAQSEIHFRLGGNKAHSLATESGKLFLEYGRNYQFVGHGTIWLDVLGDYAQEGGRPRMAPIVDQNISTS